MIRFRDIGVRAKVLLVILVPYIGGIIVASASGYSFLRIRDLTRSAEQTQVVLNEVARLRADVRSATAYEKALTDSDKVLQEKLEESVERMRVAVTSLRANTRDDPGALPLLNQIAGALAMNDEARIQGPADNRGATKKLHTPLAAEKGTEAQSRLGSINDLSSKLDERYGLRHAEFTSEIKAYVAFANRILFWGMILIALSAVVLIYLVSTSIIGPILAAVGLAETAGAGDLTQQLPADRNDEIGLLEKSLNNMVAQLRQQNGAVIEGISVLAGTAQEVADISANLNSSANKTTAAVAETTTTVSELTKSVEVATSQSKHVAETSAEAVKTSTDGRRATERTIERIGAAREQMDKVGDTVSRLNSHSEKIAEIIATVQDLADQSNLLAVNASIEAARAGDQGKGFAVVAQEIKSLADQSREATEQIRGILDDTRRRISEVVEAGEKSGDAVAAGAEEAAVAGESIGRLSQSVETAAQAAQVIDSSANQQVTAVAQVAHAMRNIDEAMRENLTGAEKLQAAVKRLEDLGGELKVMAERYTV